MTALASLFIYTAFDLNTKILLSRDLLVGNPVSMRRSMKEAFRSIRAFMKPRGIGVVLYVALVAPLLGLGMSISLTEGLYIPTFISCKSGNIANMFILHSVILDGLSVQEAGLQSKRLMKKNWKDYLKQNLIYAVITGTAGLFATPLYVMKIT